MFKVGTLVTGQDRSFRRSIYRLESIIDENTGIYRPVAYAGNIVTPLEAKRFSGRRHHNEFRVPTDEELKNAGYSAVSPLLDILNKLGIKGDSDV